MVILIRGLILGVYTSIICCSAIGMTYVLYNNLLKMHMILLYVCIFAIIVSLIISYPFFQLSEYINRLPLLQVKNNVYGVFNGKYK